MGVSGAYEGQVMCAAGARLWACGRAAVWALGTGAIGCAALALLSLWASGPHGAGHSYACIAARNPHLYGAPWSFRTGPVLVPNGVMTQVLSDNTTALR